MRIDENGDHVRLYACDLGARGIDHRCAVHLAQMIAEPENVLDVNVNDYTLAPDQDALCDGEDITSECANLSAEEIGAIERNLVGLRVLVEQSPKEEPRD